MDKYKSKTDQLKEFCNTIKKFNQRNSVWKVFNDFLFLAVLAISNQVRTPEWEEREKQYLSIINSYSKEDTNLFPQLLGHISLSFLENPEQDFLGEIYAQLNLQQQQKGQFFTPYHIAELMSALTYNDRQEEMDSKGYISVADPACGSGCMLISFGNTARKHGIDPQKEILFVGQDIDRTAAFMCYIQLAVLNFPACVIIGDTLSKPGFHSDNEVWYTPSYYINAQRFVDKLANKMDHCGETETIPKVSLGLPVFEEDGGQFSFGKKVS